MAGTRRLPQPDSLVGHRVADRYRVTGLIGHGGMAEVYRATDEALGREVALKIFRPEYASAQDLDRQQGEVRLLAKLSHPCLVTLFDAADAEGRAVLVLEFVPGTDARHRLQDGPMDAGAVAAIGADVARALAYIHSQGVIHRDVSPANILLPDSPHAVAAKLTDLGIARLVDEARLTATGLVTGTASYMSPEQVAGRQLTAASDIYSLGLVLLEALTGRREYPGTAVEAASARLARDPRIPVGLGAAWADLLREMTDRDPAGRPGAEDVVTRLSRLPDEALEVATGEPVVTQAMTRTVPASVSTGPQSTPATLVMPAPDPAPAQSPPPRIADRAAALARTRSRPRTLILVAALVAAVAVVIIAFTAIPAATRPAPDPVSSYPAVGGQLGEHLTQLEHQVSTTANP